MSAVSHIATSSLQAIPARKPPRKKSGKTEQNLVVLDGGRARTNSLLIAEKFGKKHKNVLRDIEKLECSEGFRRLNFEPSSYQNEQNKTQPMYEITRDGFSFLAMGFTGKEAATWKERFIHAFNALERELMRIAQQRHDPAWQQARLEGKTTRRELTDALHAFIGYARDQGSRSADRYWTNVTKMVSVALFGSKIDRDSLTQEQLRLLGMAEIVAARAIRDGVTASVPYKDVYQRAKSAIEQLVALVGNDRLPALAA